MKKLLFLLVFLIGCSNDYKPSTEFLLIQQVSEWNIYTWAQHMKYNHDGTNESIENIIKEYEEKNQAKRG